MTNPPLLKLQIRARVQPLPGEPMEIVEVLKDGEAIGQLPVTAIRYGAMPNNPGKISIDLYGWKVDMETHD